MKFLLAFLLFVFRVEGAQSCPPCLGCILCPTWLQELNRECCHSVVHHSAGFVQACHRSAWATRDGGGLSEGDLKDAAECCMGKGQLNTCSHRLLLMVSFGSCYGRAVRGLLWGTETSELLKEEVMEVRQLAGNRLCWCRVLERGQRFLPLSQPSKSLPRIANASAVSSFPSY